MTKEQLKEFNGQNGKPAYIGFQGKVYDISKSDFWPNGAHMGMFQAGEDLTDKIHMSPHREKNVFRFPIVDTLEDGAAAETANNAATDTVTPNSENMMSDVDKKMMEKRKWYKKNHPHPKMIHFPIGMFGLAFFLQILSIIFHLVDYKVALTIPVASATSVVGLVSTMFAVLFVIPAVASGALSFYINYNGFANSILKKKIIGSGILFICGIIAVFAGLQEFTSSTTFFKYNPLFSVYSLFILISFAVVTFIAAQGGKITWPEDKN